ncbi:MAG: hypothetical protein NC200_06830 [Candidatus Gastranaerophilales bacterium]|nr:hypothetical protein [Candidatus Gastranaerophilales bacterium]
MTNIASRLGQNNYYLQRDQLKNIAFKSEKTEEQKPVEENKESKKEKRKDIYLDSPIRALGYTNELGEAIRPISPLLANLSWLPAIAYIGADVADKYKQDEYGNEDPSGKRASKQLATQLLASVLLPTAAVKTGQSIVDNSAAYGKKGLSLTHRENISDMVIDSINTGEHKAFLTPDGKIDKALYKESLSGKIDEVIKHKKTHKKIIEPFVNVIETLKKPFIKTPKTESIKGYADAVIDRLIDTRQQLLDGIKPERMSKKAFDKFMALAKDAPIEEKQSMAFDAIKKMEKSKMFNNRVLKSIGGLVALSIMAKPIDKFVEHVIIGKMVGPAIDKVGNKPQDTNKA